MPRAKSCPQGGVPASRNPPPLDELGKLLRWNGCGCWDVLRWFDPPIAHRRRGPRSGHNDCLHESACGAATAASHQWSPRLPLEPTTDGIVSCSNQAIARPRRRFPGIISRPGGPCMAGCWFKLKVEYPRVRAETREAPEGKDPTGGALRRCTNEAVRATRLSKWYGRSRPAAEARHVPSCPGPGG